jgi:hypothetical protein
MSESAVIFSVSLLPRPRFGVVFLALRIASDILCSCDNTVCARLAVVKTKWERMMCLPGRRLAQLNSVELSLDIVKNRIEVTMLLLLPIYVLLPIILVVAQAKNNHTLQRAAGGLLTFTSVKFWRIQGFVLETVAPDTEAMISRSFKRFVLRGISVLVPAEVLPFPSVWGLCVRVYSLPRFCDHLSELS